MARDKRKKLPAAVVQGAQEGKTVHDRRARDIPANVRVASMQIDDPFGIRQGADYQNFIRKDDTRGSVHELTFTGQQKITVALAVRDDPLAALYSASQIDDAMFRAGRQWQRARELTEIGGIRGIDPTRDAVDGGQIARSTVSDGYSQAIKDLDKAKTELGRDDYSLITDILGKGVTIAKAAADRGYTTERKRASVGDWFRRCLMRLAVAYGFASKGHYKELGQPNN